MVHETISFALRLPLDYAAFTIFTPFPGTDLFNRMIADGYFSMDDINWEDLVLDKAAFKHRNISRERLKNLQRKAYLKFYFRPSKIKFFSELLSKRAVSCLI